MSIAADPTNSPTPNQVIRTDHSVIRAAYVLRSGGEAVVMTPTGRAVGLLGASDIIEAVARPGTSLDALDVIDVMRPMHDLHDQHTAPSGKP